MGLLVAAPAAAQTFPEFTGLVVDAANVLPADVEAELTGKLQALQRDTKRQLVIATVPDTQGFPLQDYGYRLGRAWGVGLRDVDNGAILFVAPGNPRGQRGPRIEVGSGLEPIITDAFASQVIRERMMPRLSESGDVPGAMTAGADALIAQLRAAPEEAQAEVDAAAAAFDRERRAEGGGGGVPLSMIFWLMVLFFVVLPLLRSGRRGRRYRRGGDGGLLPVVLWSIGNEIGRSGGWSGGGGSSGGFGGWGGGGFSGGGGGSFGGGGASGSW